MIFLFCMLFIPLALSVYPTGNTNTTENAETTSNNHSMTPNWTNHYWNGSTFECFEPPERYYGFASQDSGLIQSYNTSILMQYDADSSTPTTSRRSRFNETFYNSNNVIPHTITTPNLGGESIQVSTFFERNTYFAESYSNLQNNKHKNVSKKNTKNELERSRSKRLSNQRSQARIRLHNRNVQEALRTNDQLMQNANQKFLKGGNPEVILRQLLAEYMPTPSKEKTAENPYEEENPTVNSKVSDPSTNISTKFAFIAQYQSENSYRLWTGTNGLWMPFNISIVPRF